MDSGQGGKSTSKSKDGLQNHSPGSSNLSNRTSLFLVLFIFLLSVGSLLLVYLRFPSLDSEERQHIKLPRDMEEAKNLGQVLSKYTVEHYTTVLSAFFITYIFLQSFAIPGSIFLSILSGYLFAFPLALFLVCLCSATGATFCYLLFYLVGTNLVRKYFPQRVESWATVVHKHKDNLLNYIIFLRITPFLPNWFINIASPVINVPISTFFIGSFLGVGPPSFVFIQAGQTLHKLTTTGDAVSWYSIGILAILAVVALLPVLFKNKMKSKFD